jgi:putative SOS response-associated peptidase YedK
MCARYSLIATAEELMEWFKLRQQLSLAPRYNIAPTQPVGVVRQDPESGERRFDLMHWGLIPHWAKDKSMANRMINARSETAAEKPSFRNALRHRRCLLPCSGYYEWQQVEHRKQPYWIRMRAAPLFAFAGLWETWNSPDGGAIESCALLTMDASAGMRSIHDRMPAILLPEAYDAWLDPGQQSRESAMKLIGPLPEGALQAIAVNTHVNNPRHEGADCIAPVRLDSGAAGAGGPAGA